MQRRSWQRISALIGAVLFLVLMLNSLGCRILPVSLFTPVCILLLFVATFTVLLGQKAKIGEMRRNKGQGSNPSGT